MQPDTLAAAALPEEFLHPPYWLVSGLDWPGDSATAEAAFAVAPAIIPREVLSDDTRQILSCADLYARKHGLQVVLFSDLTRMFAGAGTSWSQLGVDWEKALRELRNGQFPALFLSISDRAHAVICDPASGLALVSAGEEQDADDARELLRSVLARQLALDWPPYMRTAAEAGRLSHG